MEYIAVDPENLLKYLNRLEPNTKAAWGTMNAQRMVEHLTEMIQMSMGIGNYTLQIAEEKIESMQRFLDSDKPMAKNITVDFAPTNYELKHEELELAVDDFIENWLAFEEYYAEQPEKTNLHPFYGYLDEKKWRRLHSKHFTHHFEQFGIL